MSETPHPFWPGLGALLLKVRAALCLNLGGAFCAAGAATAASAIFYVMLQQRQIQQQRVK